MNRKILLGISILVVMLFCIPPVASINVSDIETSTEITRPETPVSDDVKETMVTVDTPTIKRKVEPMYYTEQLQKNREVMQQADPKAYIPDYDYDSLVAKYEPTEYTRSIDRNTQVEMVPPMEPKAFKFGTPSSGSSSKTRAGEADLEVTQMEWSADINSGWVSYTDGETSPGENPIYAGFMVGVETTITVTVVNHNPTTPVSGINMNWSIYDWVAGIPLIKIPTQTPFNIMGATTTVDFKFTPPAAKWLLIIAIIDYPEDTDTSNDGFGYQGIPTLIWTSDFETGGYGDGSQTPNAWGGDTGTGNDEWHKTTSAANQLSQDHTTVNSWYHGDESTADNYDDSLELNLQSPKIDMGDITSGQKEAGILQADYYYTFAVPTWAGLYTGEAEIDGAGDPDASDVLWTYEVQDDPTTENWKEPISRWQGGWIAGDWQTIWQGQTVPTWNPNIRFLSQTQATYGWPFALLTGDGSGGTNTGNGAQNWSGVQFRSHMIGDSGADTTGPGYYADDFVAWGYQTWLPPYNIRLSEVTTLTSNDVPILYPNVQAEFDVSIENMGEALSSVPIKVTIKDESGSTVFGPQTQSVGSLAEDEEATKSFTWTPSGEGDFYVFIEAGDPAQDYTPDANDWELKVYVRNPSTKILIVDDDDSMHNNGIFIKDVELKMAQSLDDLDISYNIYTVGFNETGPTKTIMDNYDAVIWMTGLDNEYSGYRRNPNFGTGWGLTFKPEDQTQIGNFLNEGKKNMWVISPGALYDLTNTEGATSPTGFLKDYLHVIYCNANETDYNTDGDITKRGTPTILIGEVNTLGAKAEYDTYGSKPESGFIDAGGVIEADSKSDTVFFQNTARTAYNSLQYSENYNMVYFAFNYYLIPDADDRTDLTYRVLNFFGLEGGINVDPEGPKEKAIDFGRTVSFKFKATNLGLMTETMNVELVSPATIPKGWTVRINDKAPTATTNEITVGGNNGHKFFYLNVSAPEVYLDTNGNIDPNYKNTTADSEIQFKVRVESKNYPDNFYDLATATVTMGLSGHIQLTATDTEETIDISQDFEEDDHYVEYSILLRNVTNGEDDVEVLVTLDNPTDITADVVQAGSVITDSTITLLPRMDQEVSVRVTADEHEPMGEYELTFMVMDETGTEQLNETDLTTTVEQYYDIDITTDDDETYSRLVDPNAMTSDTQTEEFEVTIENYGNGPDTVTLEWVENRDSPSAIPLAWEDTLVEIFDKNGGSDTIDEIDIPAYDDLSGTPGEVTVLVKINIPQEEQEGRFWIDLQVTSSAPRQYTNNLQREDFLVEANTSFQIQMVLPELEFDTTDSTILKYDDDTSQYVKYLDQVHTIYEKNNIQISVVITNTGTATATDVDVEFAATLDNVPVKTEEDTITIEPGEEVNITFDFTTDAKGMYYFKVRIDPNNEVLGDSPQDNTWNQYLSVKEEKKDDNGGGGGTGILDTGGEGGSSALLWIIVIIVVVIIVVVLVMFFFMSKKKSEEDEIDDITMIGGPMGGGPGAMPPGGMIGMPPGGQMGGPGPGGPGMGGPGAVQPRGDTMQPAGGPAATAQLAPQARKQLPPASDAGNSCPACGEANPPENKFCQGCGGKI